MKYKIVTDGKRYKLRVKNFLCWNTVSKVSESSLGVSSLTYPVYFDSETEAETYAKKVFGTWPERVRSWRIV